MGSALLIVANSGSLDPLASIYTLQGCPCRGLMHLIKVSLVYLPELYRGIISKRELILQALPYTLYLGESFIPS